MHSDLNSSSSSTWFRPIRILGTVWWVGPYMMILGTRFPQGTYLDHLFLLLTDQQTASKGMIGLVGNVWLLVLFAWRHSQCKVVSVASATRKPELNLKWFSSLISPQTSFFLYSSKLISISFFKKPMIFLCVVLPHVNIMPVLLVTWPMEGCFLAGTFCKF